MEEKVRNIVKVSTSYGEEDLITFTNLEDNKEQYFIKYGNYDSGIYAMDFRLCMDH